MKDYQMKMGRKNTLKKQPYILRRKAKISKPTEDSVLNNFNLFRIVKDPEIKEVIKEDQKPKKHPKESKKINILKKILPKAGKKPPIQPQQIATAEETTEEGQHQQLKETLADASTPPCALEPEDTTTNSQSENEEEPQIQLQKSEESISSLYRTVILESPLNELHQDHKKSWYDSPTASQEPPPTTHAYVNPLNPFRSITKTDLKSAKRSEKN